MKIKLLLIIILIITVSASADAGILLDRVVAVVNQDVIAWSELYRLMEIDSPPQVKELGEDEKKQFFKENESGYLENLIDIKLQLQEAKNLNIKADNDEVNEAVENIRKKYSMTETELKESLKREGYLLDDYKKRIGEQITITKIVNRQIRNKVLISEEDINKFLEENSSMIDAAESYRISQIFFKKPGGNSDKIALEEKAKDLLKRIRNGEDFSEIAKKYSEDPSAASGGDLGMIRKEHLIREFSDALGSLKTGEASNPFWTDRGLHIIRLDEKVEIKNRNEIREEAKKILQNKIFMEKYNVWRKGLREKAFIEIRL